MRDVRRWKPFKEDNLHVSTLLNERIILSVMHDYVASEAEDHSIAISACMWECNWNHFHNWAVDDLERIFHNIFNP